MPIWHNPQLPPRVYHRQKAEMVVSHTFRRQLPQREPIQNLIPQEKISSGVFGEDSCTRGLDTLCQLFPMTAQHQLEQLGYRLGILLDLLLSRRIEDCETSVDVPFVGIDTKRDIDLNVLDTSDVARDLPGKLLVSRPCSAHAVESQ